MQTHSKGLGAKAKFRAAARHVKLLEAGELAEGLVEALIGYGLAHETQVQDLELHAFRESGPAIDGKRGLGRDEELETVFGAAEEAGRSRLCALVNDPGEVEGFHEAGKLRAFNARDHGGTYGADEVCIAFADKEGVCVEAADAD